VNKLVKVLATAVCACAVTTAAAEKPLTGSWCLEEDNLVITFLAKDSVHVTSTDEEGIDGWGKYEKLDTMFVATVEGGDVHIRMGYRYTWSNDSTIDAKTLFMTVNGDSINTTDKGVQMRRCGTAESEAKAKPAKKAAGGDSASVKVSNTKSEE
jgi:hypothetical protein